MNSANFLNAIVAIGVPAIVATLVYIGRKLQILDSVERDVSTLKQDIRKLDSQMHDVSVKTEARFTKIESKLLMLDDKLEFLDDKLEFVLKDRLAPSNSPRQLNDYGRSILEQPGIKEMFEAKKDFVFNQVREKKPTNPYDAERLINDIMSDLPKQFPEIIDNLKNAAFQSGADIDSVLFVGSIYLRDQIFPELGFQIKDLYKNKSS